MASYSYTQLRKLWLNAGGNKTWSYVMAAIAMAESHGNPQAHHVDSNGSVDYGLWQINSVHGYTPDYLYNPQNNAHAAVAVFNGSGPHAWSTYNNGSYKQYMPGTKNAPATDWSIFKSPSSVDQGVDFTGKGPIPALDRAKITDVGSVNIIEGGSYPEVIYKLLAGPEAGKYVYTMENINPVVKKGDVVQRGQTIATAPGKSPYIETGFNRQATGINPIDPLYPNPHSPKPAGLEMQKYIKADVGEGGGINVGGIVGDVGTGVGDVVGAVTNPVGTVLGAGGSVLKDLFGNPLSGIESLIMQGFFIFIGIALIIGGLALVAFAVLQKTGAPGVIGMAQSQMRIAQSGRRISESQRAAGARESLRGQSIQESSRASQVRESQAEARLHEQREKRILSERRLEVHERGVQRSGFEDRRFTNVRRDDRTATKTKPGRKVSGVPRKKKS